LSIIGCGLDTTFDRVDNGSLRWYDLDLPDVIDLRKRFMQEQARRKFIAASVFDDEWLRTLTIEDNVMFLAAGVFYYFEEQQMRDFFIKLANLFPESEAMFDVASPLGVRVANKVVIRAGGMDEGSILRWGIKEVKEIQLWDTRIKVLEEYPMFKGMKKGLPFRMKVGTLESDLLKIMSMVHLKFMKQ
jgi:O-methyltransferase involved in polyketide biosynthesis